jgi:zinc D-Ala-D-Ala carboxypeptidase
MNLTANFSLHKLLAEKVLQPLRDHYGVGIKVNSGYRSPDVNAAVGGSRTSDHCKGQAADIEIAGIPNATLAQYIKDSLQYTQLILEFYTPGVPDSGWVHVSYDSNNLKCQALTATKKDGKTVYLNGLVA